MRFPCPLKNFKHPVYRPAKNLEQMAGPMAYCAFVGFLLAAIGIILATRVPHP